MPEEQASFLQKEYFLQYGTTLAGLQKHHRVDPEEYQAYVHGIDLEQYLTEDRALQSMLGKVKQQLWVFTNASLHHAQRVLDVLNVSAYFSGIIDAEAVDYQPKPAPSAYRKALQIAGEKHPTQSMIVDDRIENLLPAGQLGLFTVHVHPRPSSRADLGLVRVHDLVNRLPGLRSPLPLRTD